MANKVCRGDIAKDVDTEIYSSPNRGCTSIQIDVPSGSSYGLLVSVHGLHTTGTYVPIPKGSSKTFTIMGSGGITSVLAQGDGGTASAVTWGAISIAPEVH
jgi:hypothetical protein